MKNCKTTYNKPLVLNEATVYLEHNLLAGSNVEKRVGVETGGQKVETCDFSQSGFNTEWK
ncbi:MAG: hypothetical protein IKH11_09630 [Bacteroidales bacterium]|nr:hypothetical protein [Bacteroidales bacterium]